MRQVLCDDNAFAQLIGEGSLYDYELGDVYIVAPASGTSHGAAQAKLIVALAGALPDVLVTGPTNLGVLGEPGRRWYVVPDVVVLEADAEQSVSTLWAVIAVEVQSPTEDRSRKLAAYRDVAARTGLVVGEVWYVSDGVISVHRSAAEEPGETAFPAAIDACRLALA